MQTLLVTALVAALGTPLIAADRVALLIDNGDAGDGVAALSTALEATGFEVAVKKEVSKTMRSDLETFASSCPAGGISLLYFSGFASRYDKKVGETVVREDGTKEKVYRFEPAAGIYPTGGKGPYNLDDLSRHIRERSRARLNIVIIDAASKAPMAKDDKQGLPEIDSLKFGGGMICTAMPPLETLPEGAPSLLAASLARHLPAKDAELGELMAKVKADVSRSSGGKQEIWFRFGHERNAGMSANPGRTRTISTAKTPPANPKPGDEWMNGIGMVFCWCPPGSFRMGLAKTTGPATRDAEQVDVMISNGFWISKYEVTFGDYVSARGKGPMGRYDLRDANVPLHNWGGADAESWAKSHLIKREEKLGTMPGGWIYRLPTEGEWEYACRAGTQSRYAFGDGTENLHRFANYADAALYRADDSFYYADQKGDDGVAARPAPIGCFEPNAWGIHDMHGNVSEFVIDQYKASLPGGTDPRAVPAEKEGRTFVYRGGAWCSDPEYCQSGFRNSSGPKHNKPHQGFRVVLARKK